MIDLTKLIDLLPYVYKEKDTYKVNDKGILERFLEICGNHLKNYVIADIESELANFNPESSPEMFLNFMWEYLGQLPLAYTGGIDATKYALYHNGFIANQDATLWTVPKTGPIVLTTAQVRRVLKYTLTLYKVRGTTLFFETLFHIYGFTCQIGVPTLRVSMDTAIQYLLQNTEPSSKTVPDAVVSKNTNTGAITLIKGHHYNNGDNEIRASIQENIQDIWTNTDLVSTPSSNFDYALCDEKGYVVAYLDTTDHELIHIASGIGDMYLTYYKLISEFPLYDNEYYLYDKAKYDLDPKCKQCIEAYVDISPEETGFNGVTMGTTLPDSVTSIRIGTDQSDYATKNASAISLGYVPSSRDDFITYRKFLQNLFERYLPYNVRLELFMGGVPMDDEITITMTHVDSYDSTRPNTIFRGRKNYVEKYFTVHSNWPDADLQYTISGDGSNWDSPHANNSHYRFNVPGTYYIKPVDSGYTGAPIVLVVDEVILNTWYKLSLSYTTLKITPTVPTITVTATGMEYSEELDAQGNVVVNQNYVPVVLMQGNGTRTHTTGATNDVFTFTADDAVNATSYGCQEVIFALQDHTGYTAKVDITRETEYAYGSISPVSDTIAPGHPVIGSTAMTAAFQTNYNTFPTGTTINDFIRMKCTVLPSVNLQNGGTWTVSRDGTTHFHLERQLTGDNAHDLRARAIQIVNNLVAYPSEFDFKVIRNPNLNLRIVPKKTVYYISNLTASAGMQFQLVATGTIPSGFNYNVQIIRSGTILATVSAQSLTTYTVSTAGVYTLRSVYDNTVQATIRVIYQAIPLGGEVIFITPGNATEDRWVTDWDSQPTGPGGASGARVPEATACIAKYSSGSPIKIQIDIYTNWTKTARKSREALVVRRRLNSESTWTNIAEPYSWEYFDLPINTTEGGQYQIKDTATGNLLVTLYTE